MEAEILRKILKSLKLLEALIFIMIVTLIAIFNHLP